MAENTVLHFAAKRGMSRSIEVLLAAGATANIQNTNGHTGVQHLAHQLS